ncbi:hypothetical protein [Bdellovibrio sp. HCB337]|uniref:hypothetical protein n=1 Tax=Bdellovibrio sp. HCB337 TaxID=3394358 RepID=UPI0039A52817
MTSFVTRMTRFLVCCASLVCIVACGASKDAGQGTGKRPPPDFGKPEKKFDDKDTLTLKSEELKLTHVSQAWKTNNLNQDAGAEKYKKLQKRFMFPIQFNGWISLDRVEHKYEKCSKSSNESPVFYLEDDHGGKVTLKAGEKYPVTFEKLYAVRGEFFNESTCTSVDIQFGTLYGIND